MAAAVDAVSELGVGRVTHRAVATRAGVPLGSVTYYFPTLADVVAAALEQAVQDARAELDAWAAALGDDVTDLPRAIAQLADRFVRDRPRALLEFDLYLATARAPQLLPVARVWLDGASELLAPRTGTAAARAIVALLDGVMLQALVTGSDVDTAALADAVARLIDL